MWLELQRAGLEGQCATACSGRCPRSEARATLQGRQLGVAALRLLPKRTGTPPRHAGPVLPPWPPFLSLSLSLNRLHPGPRTQRASLLQERPGKPWIASGALAASRHDCHEIAWCCKCLGAATENGLVGSAARRHAADREPGEGIVCVPAGPAADRPRQRTQRCPAPRGGAGGRRACACPSSPSISTCRTCTRSGSYTGPMSLVSNPSQGHHVKLGPQ